MIQVLSIWFIKNEIKNTAIIFLYNKLNQDS
jgi:hypothetical protein